MTLRNIDILHYSTHWNMIGPMAEMQNKKKSAKPNNFGTKLFLSF